MAKVCLMEYDTEERLFCFFREVELASVPVADDKITVDIDGIGYIFKVYDVHYTEHNRVDVNIIRISTITDYNTRLKSKILI